ncbi:hypothetical protein BJ878DRAFT_504619 [Calycina marina]|uniref:Secreted protein n=1 Tax=Calycina marina TaxID=1763456 RepID=A0A9P7Z4H6_9HELO|nr:hypothetical protein BJ878DRAFT_504619 [Calycina marina]
MHKLIVLWIRDYGCARRLLLSLILLSSSAKCCSLPSLPSHLISFSVVTTSYSQEQHCSPTNELSVKNIPRHN